MNDESQAIASLIYWKDGVEKERIERWLKKLKEQGVIESEVTNEYNPNYGGPVWYIPQKTDNTLDSSMKNHLTFKDIPVYGMFVTGPAGTLFIKINTIPIPSNVPGGMAVAIEDGNPVWTPDNRCVLEPTVKHFTEAGRKHTWEYTWRKAQEANKY